MKRMATKCYGAVAALAVLATATVVAADRVVFPAAACHPVGTSDLSVDLSGSWLNTTLGREEVLVCPLVMVSGGPHAISEAGVVVSGPVVDAQIGLFSKDGIPFGKVLPNVDQAEPGNRTRTIRWTSGLRVDVNGYAVMLVTMPPGEEGSPAKVLSYWYVDAASNGNR